MQLFKTKIHHFAIYVVITHLFAIIGVFMAISGQTHWQTILFHFTHYKIALIGVSVGAHRYWSHRSFKANKVMEIILIALHIHSGHRTSYDWAREHRVHHKFSDTDADPYNIKRGLFFAHIGWLFLDTTQEFKEKLKTVNLDDLEDNQLIMIEHRYWPLTTLVTSIIFACIPCLIWSENFITSYFIMSLGMIIEVHHVFTINSLSHYTGPRPYTKYFEATCSRLAGYLTHGEMHHNYHHTFPRDYNDSELPWSQSYNPTALAIDICEYFGWVSDKYSEKPEIIESRRKRTGDLSIVIKPRSVIAEYIIGFTVYTWNIWLIFFVRYLNAF